MGRDMLWDTTADNIFTAVLSCGIVILAVAVFVLMYSDLSCERPPSESGHYRSWNDDCPYTDWRVVTVGDGLNRHEALATERGLAHRKGCKYCEMNREFGNP